MPGNGRATQRVDTSALGARGVVALTPKVVVNNVAASFDGSPLVAEVGTLGQSLGGKRSTAAQTSERERKERERCNE